jgi:hypothetical protein
LCWTCGEAEFIAGVVGAVETFDAPESRKLETYVPAGETADGAGEGGSELRSEMVWSWPTMSWKNCCIAASPVCGMLIGRTGAPPDEGRDDDDDVSKAADACGEGEGGMLSQPEL